MAAFEQLRSHDSNPLDAQLRSVKPQVLFDESRDEIVTVVITGVDAELERYAALGARRLQ